MYTEETVYMFPHMITLCFIKSSSKFLVIFTNFGESDSKQDSRHKFGSKQNHAGFIFECLFAK